MSIPTLSLTLFTRWRSAGAFKYLNVHAQRFFGFHWESFNSSFTFTVVGRSLLKMKKAFVIFLLATSAWSEESNPKTEIEKIVGGQIAEPHSLPHQVAMIVKQDSGATLCGGSLVDDRTILTAGHCLEDSNKALVIIGAHDITANNETGVYKKLIDRANFRIHPQFNFYKAKLDIALIFLPTPVNFSESIQPVKLPSVFLFDESFAGEIGTVSGFGQYCDKCGSSQKLRFTQNRILSNEDCSRSFGYSGIPRDTHICTATSETKSGVCRGDSGGPLTIKRNESIVQVGLSSFGYRKCEEGQPTVFTRLTREIVAWVQDEIRDRKENIVGFS